MIVPKNKNKFSRITLQIWRESRKVGQIGIAYSHIFLVFNDLKLIRKFLRQYFYHSLYFCTAASATKLL